MSLRIRARPSACCGTRSEGEVLALCSVLSCALSWFIVVTSFVWPRVLEATGK